MEIEIKRKPSNDNKNSQNFLCHQCLKSFSTKGNLKNHIQTIHNNIRPFKCPYQNCTKEYSNKSRLEVHIRTHTGEKPYICLICSKCFNEKGNLKTHVGFHSKERPFKCEQCEKTYKTKGHLKDHVLVQHKKLKKHKCEICFCEFGRFSTLLAHIKTHKKNSSNREILSSEKEEKLYVVQSIDNVTTRHSSHLSLIKQNYNNKEENKFWAIQEKDFLSFSLEELENHHLDYRNIFDINFEQHQLMQYSRRNSNYNSGENAPIFNFNDEMNFLYW